MTSCVRRRSTWSAAAVDRRARRRRRRRRSTPTWSARSPGRRSARWSASGIARYQFSAAGAARRTRRSRVRKRATSSAVIPPLRSDLSNRPPGFARAARAAAAVWKAPMYQDVKHLPAGEHRLAEGRRVRHRDRGPGAHQVGPVRRDQPAEVAPQSWPTRCTGPPIVSISATTSPSSLAIRVVAAARRPGAAASSRAGPARRCAARAACSSGATVAPARRALGEAVQQHHRVAVERPLVADVEGEPVVSVAQQPSSSRCAPGCRPRAGARRPPGPPPRSPPCGSSPWPRARPPPRAGSRRPSVRRRRASAPATTIVTSPRTPSAAHATSSASGPRRTSSWVLVSSRQTAAGRSSPHASAIAASAASVRCGASKKTIVRCSSASAASRRARSPRLARQEPLEAEPVHRQPGHGQRGEHRRRPGHAR